MSEGPFRDNAVKAAPERPGITVDRRVTTLVRVEIPWRDFAEWVQSRGLEIDDLVPNHVELVGGAGIAGPVALGLAFKGFRQEQKVLR